MQRMRACLLALIIAFTGIAVDANAQTGPAEQLAASGAWRLYRGIYYFVMEEGFIGLEPSCFAQTGGDTATMDFAMLPAGINASDGQFAGVVYLQIQAPVWNFRRHTADLVLSDGTFSETIGGAFYDGNYIMVNLGGYGRRPAEFDMLAARMSGQIDVIDEHGTKLVAFSAKGLKAIYPKLLRCGGL